MDEFTHCSVCRRTPLIGEHLVVADDRGRESPLCELCLERPRAAALGEPVRRERIRSAAGAANVRAVRPQAAPSLGRAPGAGGRKSPRRAAAA